VIGTTAWYLLGDPFGIDNMFVALVIPAVVIFVEKLFHWSDSATDAKVTARAEATPR
jgi:SSS family solute:Na+ symporter